MKIEASVRSEPRTPEQCAKMPPFATHPRPHPSIPKLHIFQTNKHVFKSLQLRPLLMGLPG